MEGVVVYADKQVVISRDAFGHLSVAGSIDCFNADGVAGWLSQQIRHTVADPVLGGGLQDSAATVPLPLDLKMDLARLEFTDVTGIWALVRVAENAPDGRRLILSGLPPAIARVMSVVGWSERPNLVIE